MCGLLRSLHRSRKTVGKYFTWTRSLSPGERLKDHVVATLGKRCPVPRTVEGNEHAVAIVGRELFLVVEHSPIGCPVRGKSCHRGNFVGADAYLMATVSAVFWRQYQLLLHRVVVALRPAVIATLLKSSNSSAGNVASCSSL